MPQKNSAKFAFFYLLSLVALIFMSVATSMIIFQIINKNIVDVINQWRGRYSTDSLKFAISALIISTPIYYLTAKQIYKNLYSGELDKDAGVRKWLTYFILLISSVVMIGWLIGVINSFLDGELTLKFILKAITAIGIAVVISTFYLHDIKREETKNKKDKIIQLYFYATLGVIIIIFIASLFVVESPTETRNRKLDEVITQNFNSISRAINEYHNSNSKLPTDLTELAEEINYLRRNDLQDPMTGKEYDYKIVEDDKYELCATFRTSNKDDEEGKYRYIPHDGFGLHDAGYQCLENQVRVSVLLNQQIKAVPIEKPLPVEVVN